MPKKKSDTETIQITDYAKYRYSEEEKKQLGEDVVKLIGDLEEREAEKASATAKFNSDIKQIKLDLAEKSRNHRQGYEMRQAEIDVIMDYTSGTATYFNPFDDTIIRTRKLTQDEKQRKLFEEEGRGEGGQDAELA